MVDVGSSVLSSSTGVGARSFDVDNEHDLLALLQFIRRGPFPGEEKSRLRDLVLDYSTAKDTAVLMSVADALQSVGATLTQNGQQIGGAKSDMQPSAVSGKAVVRPVVRQAVSGFPSARPRPVFTSAPQGAAPSQTKPAAAEPVIQSVEQTVPSPQNVGAPPATPKSEVVDEVSPMPKMGIPENQTTQPSAIPDIVSAPPNQPQAPQDAPPTTPPPQPSVTPAPEPLPAAYAHTVDPLERIKEIKHLVNSEVGNPVNLIDANNTIGREYMNALLNAMRVVGSGSDDETALAMDRLEKAFTTVQTSIQSGETVIGKNAPKAVAPSAVRPASVTLGEEAIIPPTDEPSAIPDMTSSAPAMSEPTVVPQEEVAVARPLTPPMPIMAEPTPAPTPMQRLATETRLLQTNQTTPPTAARTQSIAEKLADKQASRESLLRQRAHELELQQTTEERSDPLHSNTISAGLQQLLSEWKLFKSSGLFGTGPGGYEHPLYKQLSAVPMAAIIAGRFEGATHEIKQSIADYMNGWRYEQGVVHEMNETFEHYLRRVVMEILDKQKVPKA